MQFVSTDYLKELYQEFADAPGMSTGFIIDGKDYPTDTGYAMDGIRYFLDVLGTRLNEPSLCNIDSC